MITNNSNAPAIPLACVPGAIPDAERSAHFELIARLGARLRERRDLPTGYAYRFASEDFGDLARWISNERRCCPFLRFTVELQPDEGPIWVQLTGPAGTREFLDLELSQMGRASHGWHQRASAAQPTS